MPLSVVSRIPVRYAETDRMGVVHHAVYPVYFEVGRTEFFERHFLHYDEMERRGLFAVITEYECRLRERATYGDVLLVETTGDAMKGIRLLMSYAVRRERDQKVVARGSSTLALVDPEGRPLHPRRQPDLYARLAALFPPEPAGAPVVGGEGRPAERLQGSS